MSGPWESSRVSGRVDWGPSGAWPLYRVCVRPQLCPTLCDPLDCSSPGFSVHGMFQARILQRVATSSCRASSQPRIEPAPPALPGRWILYPQSHSREPPSPCQIVQGASPDLSPHGPSPWGGSQNPERTISPRCSPSPPVSAAWDVVALCFPLVTHP